MSEIRKKDLPEGAVEELDEEPAAEEVEADAKKLAKDVADVGKFTSKKSEESSEEAEAEADDDVPIQLGSRRFVYAAFMGIAIGVAFLGSKAGSLIWYRLAQWKPGIGEPKDELVMVISAALGVGIALYYWKKQSSRQYAEEVAAELSKVTWPSKKEVVNSTTVVILTTVFATFFFAVMDRFWGYVTNLVYGT